VVDGAHGIGGRLRGLGLSIGVRNRIERFFRHLKERTVVFHHKMSARDHVQGIKNLKLFLNLFTLYYQRQRGQKVGENAYPDTIIKIEKGI